MDKTHKIDLGISLVSPRPPPERGDHPSTPFMKRIIFSILITIVFTAQASANRESIVGYSAFFYFGTSANEPAVYDDFSYYLNSINPWLTDNNIVVSYHTKTPFELKLKSGQKLGFDTDDLELDLGFVLVKPNGQFKVYYGVHTDVNIKQLAKAFFAENAL